LNDLDRSAPLAIDVRWQVDEDFACSGIRVEYHADTVCHVQLLIGPKYKTGNFTLNPSEK
jgi:hypothetical protein